MAILTKYGLNICEIDSEYPSQKQTGSCDCGNYGDKVNNCFINYDSINDDIPAGSTINYAVLGLTQVNGGYSHSEDIKFTLRSGDWRTFTWNDQPNNTNAGEQFFYGDTGNTESSTTVDIKDFIKWIIENNSPAHIIKLERIPNNTSGSKDAKRFSTTPSNHSLYVDYTPPTAPSVPTSVTLSPSPFKSSLGVSWVKGSDGTNNPITGYEVRYQSSDDGSVWGDETVIELDASVTSYSIPQDILDVYSQGKYVRARVGSKSAYFNIINSGYCPVVRKNRPPYLPTGAKVAKTSYIPGDIITVSFTNTGDPDNNLTGFEAAMKDASGNWYGDPTIVATAEGAALTSINIDTTGFAQASQWKFCVRGYDGLGVRGDWSALTDLVTMNTVPGDPEISYPVSGSTVYNKRPHILLKAAATNDGPKHILCINDGTEKTTADGTGFSCGANNNLNSAQQVVYSPAADYVLGNKSIAARMFDSYLYSPGVSQSFSIAAFTPEDADLTKPGMYIKEAMITELQTAISNLLSAYGLQAVNWTSCIRLTTYIVSAATLIGELRDALQSIINRINGWDSSSTTGDISVTWISPAAAGGGIDPIKLRQAIEQLRSIIIQI